MNQCRLCPYWYKDEDNRFECCHYVDRYPDDRAPCEYDDYEEDDL